MPSETHVSELRASEIDDELALLAVGKIGLFGILDSPVEIPSGGELIELNNPAPNTIPPVGSLRLGLGDLPSGTSKRARYWVLAAVARFRENLGRAMLINTATAMGRTSKIRASDNSSTAETPLQ